MHTRNNSSNVSVGTPPRDLTSLSPADALSLKRDGAESTILQLRQALEEARVREHADKNSAEKTDANILELRSSVRQLKRQLEKLDGEARQKHTDLVAAKQQLLLLKQQQRQQSKSSSQSINENHSLASSTMQTTESQMALAKEEKVGELQVQLDRAHAQILTADMIRKELEDTLEAEQYTWELRVQDQERTIVELQQEIGVLAEDLEQCRQQWKQADEEWAKKVKLLEQRATSSTSSSSPAELAALQAKLRTLEEERNELQTCLDEALLELEAVDAELGSHTPQEVQQLRQENQKLQEAVQKQRQLQQQQQLQQGDADFDTLEGLQHLYRWLLERSAEEGEEKKSDTMPQTSPELLDSIHHVLESMPNLDSKDRGGGSNNNKNSNVEAALKAQEEVMTKKLKELEAQLDHYKGDLQSRDISSEELRSSLKEAVALIKPLQDAVDKADQQKADLQQEIERLRVDHDTETKEMNKERLAIQSALNAKEQECDQAMHDLHRLKVELEDTQKLASARQSLVGLSPSAAAAAAVAANITSPPKEQPKNLTTLSKARADLKAKRAQEQTLRSLLRDAQNRFHAINQQNQSVEALNQQLQGRLHDMEEQQSVVNSSFSKDGSLMEPPATGGGELEHKVARLQAVLKERTMELEELKVQARQPSPEVMKRIQELESRLSSTEVELKSKVHAEKVLTKNLKEALSLLKPLKNHLEDAEAEKKELTKEVRNLRKKITSIEISGMGTVVASPNGVNTPLAGNGNKNEDNESLLRDKKQLQDTVRHLEQENSQLHDALDEMSRVNNSTNNDLLSPLDKKVAGGKPNTPGSAISNKSEARLNQEIVELKSRYEVTQSRLEDAYVENHTLVEALKEKEESEKDAIEGMRILREKLRKTEMDLENAKFIATSALVKVEEAKKMDLNRSIDSAFGGETHTVHSLEEKAIELDLLASAGIQPSRNNTNGNKSIFFHPGNNQNHQMPQQQLQQQQQGLFPGGHHQQQYHSAASWAGKRSQRLADF